MTSLRHNRARRKRRRFERGLTRLFAALHAALYPPPPFDPAWGSWSHMAAERFLRDYEITA